jgi:hypothetical protein
MSDAQFVIDEINRRRKRWLPGRILLGALGAVQLFFALPWLFGTSPFWLESLASSHHMTRDGVLGVVYGISALAVALSPRLAFFLFPLVVAAFGIQVFFYFYDHGLGDVSHLFEAIHLLGMAIVIGIGLMLVPRRVFRRKPELRLVES